MYFEYLLDTSLYHVEQQARDYRSTEYQPPPLPYEYLADKNINPTMSNVLLRSLQTFYRVLLQDLSAAGSTGNRDAEREVRSELLFFERLCEEEIVKRAKAAQHAAQNTRTKDLQQKNEGASHHDPAQRTIREAYATAAYLVSQAQDGTKSSSLIFSKTREKPQTLKDKMPTENSTPRLELLAALITARSAKLLKEALGIDKIYCCTDSQITLQRIQNGPSHYKQWVGHRIKEILTHTSDCHWFFIPIEKIPVTLQAEALTYTPSSTMTFGLQDVDIKDQPTKRSKRCRS